MVVKLVSDDAKDGEAVKNRIRNRIIVSENMNLWLKKEKPISVSVSVSLLLFLCVFLSCFLVLLVPSVFLSLSS